MGSNKSCQEQFNGILKNMAETLLVTDWKPEVTLTIGPASLRVYPANVYILYIHIHLHIHTYVHIMMGNIYIYI